MQVESELTLNLLTGASVIRPALNGGVAAWAVANQIGERVGFLVVAKVKLSPRLDVMYVERAT